VQFSSLKTETERVQAQREQMQAELKACRTELEALRVALSHVQSTSKTLSQDKVASLPLSCLSHALATVCIVHCMKHHRGIAAEFAL